jgi:hypothetical protein
MSTVVRPDFEIPQEDRERIHAGWLAMNRAAIFGYGRNTQRSMMRKAKAEHITGTDPSATAMRIVPSPACSATLRGPAPRGAA